MKTRDLSCPHLAMAWRISGTNARSARKTYFSWTDESAAAPAVGEVTKDIGESGYSRRKIAAQARPSTFPLVMRRLPSVRPPSIS